PPLYSSPFLPSRPLLSLFPYTTLFRSSRGVIQAVAGPCRGAHKTADCRSLAVAAVPVGDRTACSACPGAHDTADRDFLDPVCRLDRKSTRLNSSHGSISYAVFCLKNET